MELFSNIQTAKLRRRRQSSIDKDVLHAIASEALSDGRLLLTLERVAYSLQVDLSTVKNLVARGELPVLYIEKERQDLRRAPRVPAEALLAWTRSKFPLHPIVSFHVEKEKGDNMALKFWADVAGEKRKLAAEIQRRIEKVRESGNEADAGGQPLDGKSVFLVSIEKRGLPEWQSDSVIQANLDLAARRITEETHVLADANQITSWFNHGAE